MHIHHKCDWIWEIIHVRIKIEIHFIIVTLKHCPDSVTKLLYISRSAFYRQLFTDPVKLHKYNKDPVGPLRGYLLSSWYGQGCHGHLSGMLGTQLDQLCLLAVLTHAPTPLYAALMTSQAVLKIS